MIIFTSLIDWDPQWWFESLVFRHYSKYCLHHTIRNMLTVSMLIVYTKKVIKTKINYINTSGKDHGSLWKPNKYYSSSVTHTYNKKLKIYFQLKREKFDAINLKRWWQKKK